CDLRDGSAVEAVIDAAEDAFGPLGVLVNNAGVTRDATMRKMTEEQFDEIIAIHLKGTWNGTRAAASRMREHGGGAIVNLSSISGKVGLVGQAKYSAAKAGIVGLTKSAAKEGAFAGVRVNAVGPGLFRGACVMGVRQGGGGTNYSAAKAESVGRTKSAAKEVACAGVRVNAVQPGLIRTAMTLAMPQHVWDEKMAEIPMGRAAEPAEVANVVLFLASDLS